MTLNGLTAVPRTPATWLKINMQVSELCTATTGTTRSHSRLVHLSGNQQLSATMASYAGKPGCGFWQDQNITNYHSRTWFKALWGYSQASQPLPQVLEALKGRGPGIRHRKDGQHLLKAQPPLVICITATTLPSIMQLEEQGYTIHAKDQLIIRGSDEYQGVDRSASKLDTSACFHASIHP